MSPPRYAWLASRMLARARSSPPPPQDPDERARAIARIAQAIQGRARRRRMRQWAAAFAAVAAMALAGFGGVRVARVFGPPPEVSVAPLPVATVTPIVAHPIGSGASVILSGAQEPLDDGRPIDSGNRVLTRANGGAMLSFSTGTTGLLHESTDLTVAAIGAVQVLRLEAGSVICTLPSSTPVSGSSSTRRTARSKFAGLGSRCRWLRQTRPAAPASARASP